MKLKAVSDAVSEFDENITIILCDYEEYFSGCFLLFFVTLFSGT